MTTTSEILRYRELAASKPIAYTRVVLGQELWEKQKTVMRLAADPSVPYLSVRSGNGVGKTYLTSDIICQYLDTHTPGYAIVSSSSWTQVLKTVWPTLRRVVRQAPALLGGDLLKTEWQRGEQWGAFCVSPDQPENFSGFRTQHGCLVIVDEASALTAEVHEAIMGLSSAAGSKVIYLGNPLRPEGPFYDTFGNADWANVQISTEEVVDLGIPGLATREWIDARAREWGTDSPMYLARVKGEFPDNTATALIALGWLGHVIVPRPLRKKGTLHMGVDVARFGDDRTVIVVRDDRCVLDMIITSKKSTMETVGLVKRTAEQWRVEEENIYIDDTGVGGGVTDRLQEQDIEVVPINFGERAYDHDKFSNTRAELYWTVRERVKEHSERPFYIPKKWAALGKELTWAHYKLTSTGKIQLEAKDAIKRRKKMSPDLADALVLSFGGREDVAFGAEAA